MLAFRLSKGNLFDSRMFFSIVKAKCRNITGDSAYRAKKPREGQQLTCTQPFSKRKLDRGKHGKRVAIERTFNVLKKLGLEKGVIVKTAQSLTSHVLAVLTCLLGIQYLNLKQGFKPLAYGRFIC